jgi:hypothetical protein
LRQRPLFYQGGADSPDPAYALGVFYESKSTRSDVTGINWYAGEAVDWSKVGYTS